MSDALKPYREIAAQAWCAPETSHIEMDSRLAEEFAKILQGLSGELLRERFAWRKAVEDMMAHMKSCQSSRAWDFLRVFPEILTKHGLSLEEKK